MKKHLSTIALGLAMICSLTGFSQSEKKVLPCATYEAMDAYFEANPQNRKIYEDNERYYNELSQQMSNNKSKAAAFQYTIPVVFHVLHQGGAENTISDATIISAVQWINDDLARAHNDASLTAVPFNSLYINSDIKLMLAKKDPNGNCTNGIVRHYDARTHWDQASANSPSYYAYTWDHTRYLNVYVVAEIIEQGPVTGGGIIVGYTYKPSSGVSPSMDAIVYRYDFLSGSDARSLAHECGHWLQLAHTWGNTNSPGVACGDDGVSDTPNTKRNQFTCTNSLSGNVCNGGGTDNVENIMNYSSCPRNFTTGQTNLMRATLAATVQGRNNLWSPGNLTFTGINNTVTCPPISDCMSTTDKYTVCVGGALTMKSTSYNGTISAYAWGGTNGASFTSPSASVSAVSFPTAGSSVVSLTVTNALGSSVSSKTVTVVSGTQVAPNGMTESFEIPGIPAFWSVVNPDNDVTWDQTPVAGADGASSFFMEGANSGPGRKDYLVMPMFSPASHPNDTIFTFKYAYRRYSATHNDVFEVQGSNDCGGTWNTIISKSASNMASESGGGTSSDLYFPALSDWAKVDIYNHPNWQNYVNSPSVLVRFMFKEDPTNGFGNRFYLDDVRYTSLATGINELTRSLSLGLYPNPAKGEATLKFQLSDPSDVEINVVDVLGRNVLPSMKYNFNPGEQSIAINKDKSLGKGIYFVNLSVNGAKMSRKLVIE